MAWPLPKVLSVMGMTAALPPPFSNLPFFANNLPEGLCRIGELRSGEIVTDTSYSALAILRFGSARRIGAGGIQSGQGWWELHDWISGFETGENGIEQCVEAYATAAANHTTIQ